MVIDAGSRLLCKVVATSCWPTPNIAPHTSLHDPPYHETMKKYEDFEGNGSLSVPPAEIRDLNMVL